MIYGTRGVVERLIQHEAKPSAVSASRPQPECHKSRNARKSAHYVFYCDVGDCLKSYARVCTEHCSAYCTGPAV